MLPFLRSLHLNVYLKMAMVPVGGVVLESVRPCSDRVGINRLSVIGRTAVLPANKSMSNIRSDTEDAGPDVVPQSFGAEADASVLRRRNDRTIHSGHFMLSHVHDDSSPAESSREDIVDDDSDVEVDYQENSLGGKPAGVHLHAPSEPGSGLKNTSHLAIDTSLTKLFQCMTLAYRFCFTRYVSLLALYYIQSVVPKLGL